MRIAVALVLVLLLQDSPPELIEQLLAERIQDRSNAQSKLVALGKAAIPDLERAARSPDPELARRAGIILRTITLKETLTPAVFKAVPNAAEMLASGTDQAYTVVFLKLVRTPDHQSADLEALALQALRGAEPKERYQVMNYVIVLRLRSVLPELRRMAGDAKEPLGDQAIHGMLNLDAEGGKALLLGLLRSPDPTLRCRGLSGLQRVAGDDVSVACAALLSDSDQPVRMTALATLNAHRAYGMLPRIVACLKDQDRSVTLSAAHILVDWDRPETQALVLPLLRDPAPLVRIRAIHILGQMQIVDAGPSILELLQDRDRQVREAAAWGTADLKIPGAGPKLTPLLSDKEDQVRIAALWAAMQLDLPIPNESLLGYLMHQESDVRLAGAWAAGRTRFTKSPTSLLRILDDSDSQTAAMAAWAAGRCGVKEAVPVLLRHAKGADSKAAASAAALAQLVDADSLPSMLELIETGNPAAVESIAASVRRLSITPAQMDGLLQKLAPGAFRLRVVSLLGALADPRAIPALLKIVKDPEEDGPTRGSAALALARLRHADAVPALIDLAKGSQPEPASSAVHALRCLGARQALPELKTLFNTDNQGVFMTELIRAFDEFGVVDQRSLVIGKLDDLNSPADHAAANWLCHTGTLGGAEWLAGEGDGMLAINAVRDPAAWKKLTAVTYTEPIEGTRFEIAARIAADAGMTLDLRYSHILTDITDLLVLDRIDPAGQRLRADQALEELMPKLDDDYDVVLDGNTLRILPSNKAHAILKGWVDKEKKR